jgi:large subunit ribosomal protein L10
VKEEVTMDNPRAEKVAVVEEVQQRFGDADAAILTEYRGLKVKELAGLRRSLRASGGEYKIYKNTLVRLAASRSGLSELEELLVGPTAITFVSGDAAAVAKVLRDFARTNPLLIIKGGVLGDRIIGSRETAALAELPSREMLLARFAGLLAAPLQQLGGLMQALPRNLAFGLAALRDQKSAGQPEGEAAGQPEAAEPAPTEAVAPEPAPTGAAEPAPDEGTADGSAADTAAEASSVESSAAEPESTPSTPSAEDAADASTETAADAPAVDPESTPSAE